MHTGTHPSCTKASLPSSSIFAVFFALCFFSFPVCKVRRRYFHSGMLDCSCWYTLVELPAVALELSEHLTQDRPDLRSSLTWDLTQPKTQLGSSRPETQPGPRPYRTWDHHLSCKFNGSPKKKNFDFFFGDLTLTLPNLTSPMLIVRSSYLPICNVMSFWPVVFPCFIHNKLYLFFFFVTLNTHLNLLV